MNPVSFRRGGLFILAVLLAGACQPQPHPREGVPTPESSLNPSATDRALPATRTPQFPSPSPDRLLHTPTASLPYNLTLQAPTSPPPTPLPTTTLLFTGVIVPARCVQAAIDARGDSDYPYEEVGEILREADLSIGTLNATISDYPPRTGCVSTYVLVGGSENADALARAGFDLMSVATNHIKNCGLNNCGDRAFFDTLENLQRVGIVPIGAGRNHREAVQPVVSEVNGVRFGFVSLGQLEPLVFAGRDTPGIGVLNPDNLRAAIQAARRVADVVIVMPHWGPEDTPTPNYLQRDLAQAAVQAGADLVVGNHTHVVQAIQELEGVPVFYGLGNFVFDQDWARDHQQGVILRVYFEGNTLLDYELIPTHVDADGRVHIADLDEAAEILDRIAEVSQQLR